MDYKNLIEQLLSADEQNELSASARLLEGGDYSAFYEKNAEIVKSILFLEDSDEFLDFAEEDELDMECFCFAFLCARKYGFQAGGYEEDLTGRLTAFFGEKEFGYPEILEIIGREKIYTDCDGRDNFRKSMEEINRVLDIHGLKAVVFEDCVYCECEYTVLILEKSLAEGIRDSWESDNFSVSL